MDSATSSSTNTTPSAADIVSAALRREGIDPDKMGIYGVGYLNLIKGRPHITIGFRTLLKSTTALLVALWQAAFMYVFVHDAIQFFNHERNTIWLHHIPRSTWFGIQWLDTAVFLFLAASVPFFILNLGWGLMAAAIAGRWRATILLSGFTGMVPLRLFAGTQMPKWWFFQVDWRLDLSLAARILQFSWAYKLATGRSKAEIEMDWAQALDRHTKPLLDGLLSYAIQPILVLPVLLLGMLAIDFTFNTDALGWVFNLSRFPFGDAEEIVAPYFSYLALFGAWLAFERACLGAMVFRFLSEADAGEHTQARTIFHGMMILGILTIFVIVVVRWTQAVNKDVPFPSFKSFLIDKSLHAAGHERYGVFGWVVPITEQGYFFSVVKNNNGVPLLHVFLRPGESFYYPIPAGHYTMKSYHGLAWKGSKYAFGFSTDIVEGDTFTVCPHDLLNPMNKRAVAGAVSALCEEPDVPIADVDEYYKTKSKVYLLCASQRPVYGDAIPSLYLPGANPDKISCNTDIRSMKNPLPFWPIVNAIASMSVEYDTPVGYCMSCDLPSDILPP